MTFSKFQPCLFSDVQVDGLVELNMNLLISDIDNCSSLGNVDLSYSYAAHHDDCHQVALKQSFHTSLTPQQS